MNHDILEALCALAVACSGEARRRHPALFSDSPSSELTDEQHAVVRVVSSIEALIDSLDDLLGPDWDRAYDRELPDWDEDLLVPDDIPFD